jgi:hypothetical protein
MFVLGLYPERTVFFPLVADARYLMEYRPGVRRAIVIRFLRIVRRIVFRLPILRISRLYATFILVAAAARVLALAKVESPTSNSARSILTRAPFLPPSAFTMRTSGGDSMRAPDSSWRAGSVIGDRNINWYVLLGTPAEARFVAAEEKATNADLEVKPLAPMESMAPRENSSWSAPLASFPGVPSDVALTSMVAPVERSLRYV